MKRLLRCSLTAGLISLGLAPASLLSQSAPYLETAPLSILWNFTITGVSGTTIGPRPIAVAPDGSIPGVEDPDSLRPVDRVTTEKGVPITYNTGNGDQAFFVKHLLRAVIEDGSQGLTEQDLTGRWELTAVREPQTTVEGMATTPYAIFLTRIEGTAPGGRPSKTYNTSSLEVTTAEPALVDDPATEEEDQIPGFEPLVVNTGLFLTFDQFVGNYTETVVEDRVTRASGNITVAYSINFTSVFAEDPRYLVLETEDDNPPAIGEDFHSRVNTWNAFATGIMTANVRTTVGPLPAITASKIKMTATGSWSHRFVDYTNYPEKITGFGLGGLAPLAIKIGESKFQRRERFPTFSAP